MMTTRNPSALLCLSIVCFLLAPPLSADTDGAETAVPRQLEPFAELDVFALEWASDPRISPDGEQVVYVRNGFDVMKDRRRSSLWIVDADGTGHEQLDDAERNASSPRWSPSGDRIAWVAGTDEGSEIFVRWLGSGRTARLSQLPASPRHLTWSSNGEWLAFSMLVRDEDPKLVKPPKKPEGAEWAEPPRVTTRVYHEADGRGRLEPGFHHLFVLPAIGGTPRQVTSGDFHHRDAPSFTPDGSALVFSANRAEDWEYDFIESEVHHLTLADGTLRTLTDRNGPDRDPVVSPDGRQIAWLGYDDKVQTYQVTELYAMGIDGSGKRLLSAGLDRSVSSPVWAADGRSVYVRYEDRGRTKIGRIGLDGTVETLADDLGGTSIGRPYPGGSFTVASGGRVAYTATDPTHPAEVTLIDGATSRRLSALNADLLPHRELGRVEEIVFESSHDGLEIQGWMVEPPGFDPAEKYPLLLEIHGGPTANYGERFSPEMQLYAAAGYLVLYVNPRGSTGYGERFGNLLYHDYPGHDYDDLISGVDAVIARGHVDPERLYVTGGSAGGIMTAWIVGSTDRFRAAAVVKPVINWYSKVLVADNYFYYHDYRYPGSPWENPEEYMKYSPISRVGNVSTPSLVMVGTEDLRTPLSESKQLYHALKLRRIDTALVEIPGASHAIGRRPSQMITKVAHVLAWFEQYGGPARATEDGEETQGR